MIIQWLLLKHPSQYMPQDRITVSAPGKLMLFGEHAVVYNRSCIVTAVDQRMKAIIELLKESVFELEASDVDVINYRKPLADLGNGDIPKGAKFVEIAVKNIFEKHGIKTGIKITTFSEFSSQFGFGSSSASTVCIVKGLSELLGLNLNDKEIFELSYKTVLDIQGKGSGFDIAAAVYGGILYFVTGGKIITSLNIKNLPLVAGYSGIKADTVDLINKVKEKSDREPEKVVTIYNAIEEIVNNARSEIVSGSWEELGKLMNLNQKLLKELGVSIKKLDNMIKASLDAGAYGAKLSGAGGGDCMIAICPKEKELLVKAGIAQVGGEVINVKTNAEGVRIEK